MLAKYRLSYLISSLQPPNPGQHVNFEVPLMFLDVVSYIKAVCRNSAFSSKKILEWFKIDEENLTSSFGRLWTTSLGAAKDKNADKYVKVTEGLGSPRPYVNLLVGIWATSI